MLLRSKMTLMKFLQFMVALLTIWVGTADTSHARAVDWKEMPELMRESALVFVGEVKSITPSGLTTKLTYPTWKGSVFEWLKVDVEVIEPIKGTVKGRTVQTMMLSVRGFGPIVNPPGMVRPEPGQRHLLCLLPTTIDGTYASLTAPFDDQQAIFLLDRKSWSSGRYFKDDKEVAFRHQSDKNAALWNLVDAKGRIQPKGAQEIRVKYRAEISTTPPKDQVIHLKWKKMTAKGGLQWNEPDAKTPPRTKRRGPVSKH